MCEQFEKLCETYIYTLFFVLAEAKRYSHSIQAVSNGPWKSHP